MIERISKILVEAIRTGNAPTVINHFYNGCFIIDIYWGKCWWVKSGKIQNKQKWASRLDAISEWFILDTLGNNFLISAFSFFLCRSPDFLVARKPWGIKSLTLPLLHHWFPNLVLLSFLSRYSSIKVISILPLLFKRFCNSAYNFNKRNLLLFHFFNKYPVIVLSAVELP